jgi:DNA-binding GntR family transcriptional regulator
VAQPLIELPNRPLFLDAIHAIREAILSGQLSPGARLIQADLAMQLGISRAPVREAFRKLEEEGLVITTPYRGTIVAPLTERHIREVSSLRTTLEVFAVSLVIARDDPETLPALRAITDEMDAAATRADLLALGERDLAFHAKICALSDHQLLYQTWATNSQHLRRILSLRNSMNTDLHDIVILHYPILDAIARRDTVMAEKHVRRHGNDMVEMLMAAFGALDEPRCGGRSK